jgi:hypothetical protein
MHPTRVYNRFTMNGNQWNRWTAEGMALEHAVNTNMHLTTHDNWEFDWGGTIGQLGSTYCDRCSRGGPALRQSPYFAPWAGFTGDDRRRIFPSLYVNTQRGDGGRSHYLSIEPMVTLQASSQLVFSLDVTASSNQDDGQWIGNFGDSTAHATHYAFAHLDQHTLSSAFRMTYIATPNLSLQVYAQPFVSSGSYSDPRELSATPRAANYDARYVAYTPPASAMAGFNDREFRSNTVLRWEYRPGSTLFLVWTQGRSQYDDQFRRRSWSGNYRDLFSLRPDNTFLVKVSYWLSR